jgi:hypothetical protein
MRRPNLSAAVVSVRQPGALSSVSQATTAGCDRSWVSVGVTPSKRFALGKQNWSGSLNGDSSAGGGAYSGVGGAGRGRARAVVAKPHRVTARSTNSAVRTVRRIPAIMSGWVK